MSDNEWEESASTSLWSSVLTRTERKNHITKSKHPFNKQNINISPIEQRLHRPNTHTHRHIHCTRLLFHLLPVGVFFFNTKRKQTFSHHSLLVSPPRCMYVFLVDLKASNTAINIIIIAIGTHQYATKTSTTRISKPTPPSLFVARRPPGFRSLRSSSKDDVSSCSQLLA